MLALKIELTARDTDRAVERGDLIIVIDVLSAIGDLEEKLTNYIRDEYEKSIKKLTRK